MKLSDADHASLSRVRTALAREGEYPTALSSLWVEWDGALVSLAHAALAPPVLLATPATHL